MELLLNVIRQLPEYNQIRVCLQKGKHAAVSGAAQLNRSHLIAALFRDCDRPALVVCQDELAAERTAEELEAFLGAKIPVLPGRDLTFYDTSAASRGWEHKRLRLLYDMALGKVPLAVATWEALSLRTLPRQALTGAAITLHPGDLFRPDDLSKRLTACGYSRCTLVEGIGQYALRGDILDVFSPAADNPVRIEFFGDEIDTMGSFDVLSQRRIENLPEMVLLPVAETQPQLHPGGTEGLIEDLRQLIARQRRRKTKNDELLRTLSADLEKLENGTVFQAADRYMSLIYPEYVTAADYLPENAAVFFCDHGNLRRSANGRQEDVGLMLDSLLQSGVLAGELCDFCKDWEEECAELRAHPSLFLDSFLSAAYPGCMEPSVISGITAKQLPSYGGSLETAANDLATYHRHGFAVLVLCGNRRRAELLQEYLQQQEISTSMAFSAERLPKPGEVFLTDGSLPNGMEYPTVRLAILSEGQLVPRAGKKRTPKKRGATNRQKLNSFTDLSPGDYVVHEVYGIGKYVCMEQIRIDGTIRDYIKIAYQGTDVLYVPATQLDMISKYIGGGEDSPVRLNKLSGDTWQKTKARAKAAVKDLAEGLIKLYAERKRLPGYAFSPDAPWQQEFEDNFEYEETDDQIRCIAEIKGDMESHAPMDRLLCGDVGFGKTEVALRAAMKAILDGKQVAILVPTTVLAQQHYLTAVRRFAGFPVTVDVLSRFRTPAQQRETLEQLRSGRVDLIIGTHKLLQKEIKFKSLGLLIVDEEQRFGVSHKEKLKELSRGVDVLTLSATPIPRTLNMALSGLRDMSTLEEPPQDRYPVQTFVLEYNEPVLDDAMRRELGRGGQIYYLHNRVDTIEQCAARLRQRLPEVEIATAHGKMSEDQLGEVMQRMADGEIGVLVCSTIIETGIDISNVNTLIIEDADKLGLAQLHQIRGRVGRSARHAFAYLTFRKGKVLTEIAEKRLTAIREYAEFGSGFKIAMRDLEIRGAGNLLGAEQSGHMLSVGYDMYLKLLEDAVLEGRGEKPASETECTADIVVTANIDSRYVESGEQRMDLYRRMAAIRSKEDADDLLDEIVDRYGDPPKGVMNLIDIALLRARAAKLGITQITQKAAELFFTMRSIDFTAMATVFDRPELRGRIFIVPTEKQPTVRIRMKSGESSLKLAQQYVALIEQFCEKKE